MGAWRSDSIYHSAVGSSAFLYWSFEVVFFFCLESVLNIYEKNGEQFIHGNNSSKLDEHPWMNIVNLKSCTELWWIIEMTNKFWFLGWLSCVHGIGILIKPNGVCWSWNFVSENSVRALLISFFTSSRLYYTFASAVLNKFLL